jgi:hypothetical protein
MVMRSSLVNILFLLLYPFENPDGKLKSRLLDFVNGLVECLELRDESQMMRWFSNDYFALLGKIAGMCCGVLYSDQQLTTLGHSRGQLLR